MKLKGLLAILLLVVAGLQSARAQGFRIYNSDGTVMQFSLRTDSIVFYDGIGSDVDFGPFTPVNQCIVGTWYITKTETVTFYEDGTTDYMQGATYKFLPYQGTIIFFEANKAPALIMKVHDVTAESMVVSTLGESGFSVLTRSPQQGQGITVGHAYVDLGLPSGTLWATCNIGASSPLDYGDYFAWGETTTKGDYDWDTYKYCEGSYNTITKYCTQSDYGYNGFTDGQTELLPEDDAATANWGSDWQMPSIDQFDELFNSDYTTTEWTSLNGVFGNKITSKSNGKSIFLPAAGYRSGTNLEEAGFRGSYWSRSLSTSYSDNAYYLFFRSGIIETYDKYRYYGRSVRPVRKK